MKLEQLKYFLETARFQHVGKAGQALHISPSAISSAIAGLEEELQVTLFDRIGNRIYLSEDGKRLKLRAESLFDFVDQIRGEFVPGRSQGFVGDFKMGGSHFLATHYLAPVWNKFQKLNPELVGEISPDRTVDVMNGVLAGELDFGLCFSPFKHPDLVLTDLHRGQMQLVVRKGHPARTLKDLSNYPAIIHKAAAGVDLCEDHPEFTRLGIRCRISQYFASDSLAVQALADSDAWSLLPDLVVGRYKGRLWSLPLPRDWNAPYTVTVVVRKSRQANPVVEALTMGLKQELERIAGTA